MGQFHLEFNSLANTNYQFREGGRGGERTTEEGERNEIRLHREQQMKH